MHVQGTTVKVQQYSYMPDKKHATFQQTFRWKELDNHERATQVCFV